MQQRKFGKTELTPSAIGFGCAPLLSRSTKKESVMALNKAFELGITFYDTADFYGQGDSESILGEVFKKTRAQIILSTKAGQNYHSSVTSLKKLKDIARPLVQQFQSVKKAATQFLSSQTGKSNFSIDYLKTALEQSLKRLQTDYVDLFLLHNPPIEIINDERVFEFLESMKKTGKIRYYGVSCRSVNEALVALKYAGSGLSAVQVAVNVLEQEAIDHLLPACAKDRVAVVAREPFAHGRLFEQPNLLVSISEKTGLTPAQVALKFVLQIPEVSVVLPSMISLKHLAENVAALDRPPLESGDIEKMRKIFGN